MKTKTVEEAMDLLHTFRREHIANGRRVADELIAKYGTTNTKAVYDEMDARGLVDHSIREHWLAAIFRQSKYRWTGRMTQGRGHDALAKEWGFANV